MRTPPAQAAGWAIGKQILGAWVLRAWCRRGPRALGRASSVLWMNGLEGRDVDRGQSLHEKTLHYLSVHTSSMEPHNEWVSDKSSLKK